MAEQPTEHPTAQPTPPQPPPQPRPEGTPPQPGMGPAGPPGPEGPTHQGTTPQGPPPGVGGFVEPGQPTEGAGLPKPEERDDQARRDRETREGVQAQAQAAPEMNQSHDVLVGDKVQLNGTLFNVSSGQYDWSCKGPDGETVPLTNATMPGPSFTATQEGAYVSKLTTDDGIATITVNAAETDVQPLAGAQTRVPLHSGGTLVGPSPEVERLRMQEALHVSGQLTSEQQRRQEEQRQQEELGGQQRQARPGETEEQRRQREAQAQQAQQSQARPGETEEQRRQREAQQSQARPGETEEQRQERVRREEQERERQRREGQPQSV